MKTILSVYDTTGEWSAPYLEAGHDVLAADIKNPMPIDARDFSVEWFFEHLGLEEADGILLAPPCTDFCSAGAQYWPKKDQDGTTAAAIELAMQALRAVELFRPDFWALENPIGRLAKLVPALGKPRLIFDPCDYAGWTNPSAQDIARLDDLRARNGKGEWTAEEVELVKRTNAYTKRTCLWGDFALPEKRRIEPVRVCATGSWLMKLGGKSEATKAARSVTPAGFAQAFYAANNWEGANADRQRVHQAALYLRSVFDGEASVDDLVRELRAEFGDDLDAAAVVADFRASR